MQTRDNEGIVKIFFCASIVPLSLLRQTKRVYFFALYLSFKRKTKEGTKASIPFVSLPFCVPSLLCPFPCAARLRKLLAQPWRDKSCSYLFATLSFAREKIQRRTRQGIKGWRDKGIIAAKGYRDTGCEEIRAIIPFVSLPLQGIIAFFIPSRDTTHLCPFFCKAAKG